MTNNSSSAVVVVHDADDISLIWVSFGWGLISAVSLNIGAAVGVTCLPGAKIRAVLMAFGGGALLFALSIELFGHTVERSESGDCSGCIWVMETAAVFGGVFFAALNRLLQSGLCKSSLPRSASQKRLGNRKLDRRSSGAAGLARRLHPVTGAWRWLGRQAQRLPWRQPSPGDAALTRFMRGEAITCAPSDGSAVYFIVKGLVRVDLFSATADGMAPSAADAAKLAWLSSEEGCPDKQGRPSPPADKSLLSVELGPGQIFGDVSSLTGSCVQTAIAALEATEILTIPVRKVDGILEKPAVWDEIVARVGRPAIWEDVVGRSQELLRHRPKGSDARPAKGDAAKVAPMPLPGSVADVGAGFVEAALTTVVRVGSKGEVRTSRSVGVGVGVGVGPDADVAAGVPTSTSAAQSLDADVAAGVPPQARVFDAVPMPAPTLVKVQADAGLFGSKSENHEKGTKERSWSPDSAIFEEEMILIEEEKRLALAREEKEVLCISRGCGDTPVDDDDDEDVHVRKGSRESNYSKASNDSVDFGIGSGLIDDGHHGHAAMMVWLGILIDAVPESLVIGILINEAEGSVSKALPFVVGVFLSNLPESMSASGAMKAHGIPVSTITLLWAFITAVTACGALIGAALFPPSTVHEVETMMIMSGIEGVAAGSMLTMIAQTMMPEAFEQGGDVVGLSCLAGFLAATTVRSLGHMSF